MSKKSVEMQKMEELRQRVLAEIATHERALFALQNKLAGIDAALFVMRGNPSDPTVPAPRRRNVKRVVMEIIGEAGANGVTAAEVVDRAAAKGKDLDRASVSSLLSRFKREGFLFFDGERYRAASPHGPQSTLKVV